MSRVLICFANVHVMFPNYRPVLTSNQITFTSFLLQHVSKNMAHRFNCEVKCSSCHRCFKSSRTILKHSLTKHEVCLDINGLDFFDRSGAKVSLPKPKQISPSRLEAYNSWVASLTERIGEALHPALPGKHVI